MESETSEKTKMETLLIEDLLSPRAFEQWRRGELDLFSNIPIRTWATGSPLKQGQDGSEKREKDIDPEDLVDYSEGLDAYFAKTVGQIEEGQDEEENEDDDALINEMENYLAEDDDGDQGYSTNFHEESIIEQLAKNSQLLQSSHIIDQEDTVLQEDEDDNGAEDDEDEDEDYEDDAEIEADAPSFDYQEEKVTHGSDIVMKQADVENEDDYEDDYEPENSQQKGYSGLFDLQGDQNDENESEEDNDDEDEDYEDDNSDDDEQDRNADGIASDYNDLLMYMNSPRDGESKVVMDQKLPRVAKNQNATAALFIPGLGKGDVPVMQDRKENKKPSKPTKRKSTTENPKNHNVKSSGYNVQKKKDKNKTKRQVSANGNEAMRRHKEMLAAMVNRRKQEEEEIAQMAAVENEKRKKFKEALLEKAARSKKAQEEALAALSAEKIPSFLNPTHAYKAQSVASKKGGEQINMTEEEILLQDQQKREYIAQIRRKFKEQHKKTLMALVAKKREEEAKHEQQKQEEEILKEKRRQKLLKLLAEKEEAIINYNRIESTSENPSEVPVSDLVGKTSSASDGQREKPKRRRPSMDGKPPVTTPPSAAGSGLAAIRSRQNPNEESVPMNSSRNNAHNKDRTPQPAAVNAQATGEQKAKLTEYLQQLQEQKKKEEKEKLKLEERKKRRVALLRERILQEAAERKLMMMEDDPKHHASNNANELDDKDKPKKVKKITPEMAEAMAARLNGNKSSSSQPSQPQPPNLVPKPPSLPKKSTTTTAITSSSAPSTAISSSSSTAKDKKEAKEEKEPRSTANTRTSKLRESSSADAGDENQPSNSLLASTTSTAISTVPARDFNDWKRKNHVPPDGKVFCMTGWYPCVKQALLDRGWHFNPDPASPYFHLKWTLRSLDVNHETLQPWQLINHFMKNVAITTKCGLIKSLQSLKWMADVDASDIIPRAYDLSVQHDIQAFLDDFRSQLAENSLKKLYLKLTGIEKLTAPASSSSSSEKVASLESEEDSEDSGEIRPEQSTTTVEHNTNANTNSNNMADIFQAMSNDPVIPPMPALLNPSIFEATQGESIPPFAMINPAVFESTCRILESLLKPYEDAYLDDDSQVLSTTLPGGSFISGNNTSNNNNNNSSSTTQATFAIPWKVVSDLDWEIVENYDLYTAYPQGLPAVAAEPIDNFLSSMFNSPEGDGGVDTSVEWKLSHALRREKKKHARWLEDQRQQAHDTIKRCRRLTATDVERVHVLLHRLRAYHGPQHPLNGSHAQGHNMWIVKPASKSRGRGIMTFNDLPKLLKYVQISNTVAGSGSAQWVVQKYMENPLIIANRKFDMRQWVLVYDWNPLTIYFYDEFYARFSVEEYSIENTDMDNVYVHLVNNSIGKNSEHFHKLVTAENGVPIEGFMWSYEDFSAYVAGRNGGRDIVKEKIQPRMKEIAKWALMCGAESIEHRRNSWELYGFDYMVDEDYNAWLIEINSSPACDYSTKVTERYVQKALVEILSIVLDTREWEQQSKKNRGPAPDVGGWDLIYKGPTVDLPAGSFGTEMTLKGEGYKGLKRPANNNNNNPLAPPPPPPSLTQPLGKATQQQSSSSSVSQQHQQQQQQKKLSQRSQSNPGWSQSNLQQPSPVSPTAAAVVVKAVKTVGGSSSSSGGVVPPVYDESDDAFNDSDDDGSVGRTSSKPQQQQHLSTTTTTTTTTNKAYLSSSKGLSGKGRVAAGIALPATATAASNNGGIGAVSIPVKTLTLDL